MCKIMHDVLSVGEEVEIYESLCGSTAGIRIEEEIGRGGNAVVYTCKAEPDGKRYVLKRAGQDRACKKQLENEGNILRHLMETDFHGCPGFIGEAEGALVMECIEGVTLDRTDIGELSEEEMRELFIKICELVGCLHGLKVPVIHRDLKPSNIMVDESGEVRLIDFGTARMLDCYDSAGGLIRSGVDMAGTRNYAAPEQYGGLGPENFRTDIYQMGRIFRALIRKSRTDPFFAEEIMRIADRCCNPDPGIRYGGCDEIKRDLLNARVRRGRRLHTDAAPLRYKSKTLRKIMRKRREPRVFIDIVRTCDSIEFL